MDDLGFTPVQRKIYSYDNGKGEKVFADPNKLMADLALAANFHNKTINGLIDTSKAVDVKDAPPMEVAQAWEALSMLHEISVKVFSLVPFDAKTGQGADRAHALGLLNHFHKFLKKNYPKLGTQPTSSPSTDSTSAIPATTATSSV